MFEAKIFLAGPSRYEEQKMNAEWDRVRPCGGRDFSKIPTNIYVADGALDSFLSWADELDPQSLGHILSVVWCGDGDSLGKHAKEILSQTAARFEGRWREHFYQTDKDFSDCAAIVSLIEYDIRQFAPPVDACWLRVFGALAGRYDHELANLFEFSTMLTRLTCPAVVQLGPSRTVSTADVCLNMEPGMQFSLIPAVAHHNCAVKISGARYSGEVVLRQPSHGISNVAQAEHVCVEPLNTFSPVNIIIPPRNS